MAGISKKKLKQIRMLSFSDELLREYEARTFVGAHWVTQPPETWSPDEKNRFDMMYENEIKLKEAILKIIQGEK